MTDRSASALGLGRPRVWPWGRIALALALTIPSAGAAQVDDLAGRCFLTGTAGSALECEQFALATRFAQAGAGLAQTGGNPFTGSASTLGRRFGVSPRVALSARASVTRFPVLAVQGGAGNAFSMGKAWAPSLQGQATVGLFHGFSPAPTMSGLFAVDVLGHVGVSFLPGGQGFDGRVVGWGYGARVGIFRESFTLPGVTLSLGQTRSSGVDYDGDRVGVRLDDVVTTALRLVIGKELMIGGLLAGAGWNRYQSDGEMRWTGPILGETPVPTALDGFKSSRVLLFAGWSKTILVTQIAGEIGWAGGFDDETPRIQGVDSGSASWYGTLSFRLTI
ncbi:MAG: hypothetical protein JSU98_09630 [Gemmatimonadales bacterium]|nr:MAG: hypothetical protein JSU98_09630 [Gemmatimonadales bacterium]